MRELTPSEYERLSTHHKRRYGVFELGSGRVALRSPVTSPCYWFERSDIGQEHPSGRYIQVPHLATVSLWVDGKVSAFFYLAGRRLDTCTFAYDLSQAQLDRAVKAMRRAKLGRLIIPAAEWALREMPSSRRSQLEPPLRKLVAKAARVRHHPRRAAEQRGAPAKGRR